MAQPQNIIATTGNYKNDLPALKAKKKRVSNLGWAAAAAFALTAGAAAYSAGHLWSQLNVLGEKSTPSNDIAIIKTNPGIKNGAEVTLFGILASGLLLVRYRRVHENVEALTAKPPAAYDVSDVFGDAPAIGIEGNRPSSATPAKKHVALAPQRAFRFPSTSATFVEPV